MADKVPPRKSRDVVGLGCVHAHQSPGATGERNFLRASPRRSLFEFVPSTVASADQTIVPVTGAVSDGASSRTATGTTLPEASALQPQRHSVNTRSEPTKRGNDLMPHLAHGILEISRIITRQHGASLRAGKTKCRELLRVSLLSATEDREQKEVGLEAKRNKC